MNTWSNSFIKLSVHNCYFRRTFRRKNHSCPLGVRVLRPKIWRMSWITTTLTTILNYRLDLLHKGSIDRSLLEEDYSMEEYWILSQWKVSLIFDLTSFKKVTTSVLVEDYDEINCLSLSCRNIDTWKKKRLLTIWPCLGIPIHHHYVIHSWFTNFHQQTSLEEN